MRRKGLLALLLLAGIVAAGAFAYDAARPRVHPIKVADAIKYGQPTTESAAVQSPSPRALDDPRTDLFGIAEVVDGDTLRVQGVEADLWTIDAPELAQTCQRDGKPWACGETSRANLERLAGGRNVACTPEGPPTDATGWLGVCYVADVPCNRDTGPCESSLGSLNLQQVSEGWAVDMEGQFAEDQEEAQAHKSGIWAAAFELPWDWRKQRGSTD